MTFTKWGGVFPGSCYALFVRRDVPHGLRSGTNVQKRLSIRCLRRLSPGAGQGGCTLREGAVPGPAWGGCTLRRQRACARRLYVA